MKKNTTIIIVISILFSACSDFLEIYPPSGLITDKFWKTKEDIDAVLMGAYRTFADMDRDLFLHGELRADMVSTRTNAGDNIKNIKQGNIVSDNDFVKWTGFYATINYCNLVLHFAPGVLNEDPTFNIVQLEYFKSEAKFLRGLAYFYLVRIYNKVPYIAEPTLADDSELYYPNISADSVLAAVVADLQTITKNSLPFDYGRPEFNKGRATYKAVQALLADIALWQFRYNDCLNHIQTLEDNSIGGLYILPKDNWSYLFYPGNSEESIFEFQFSDADAESNHLYEFTYSNTYKIAATTSAESYFSEDEFTAIRRSYSMGADLKIRKYALDDAGSGRSESYKKAANFFIYRNADIILMKAEALAMQEEYDEAEELLNQIHTRSNENELEILRSKNAFEDAILNERAKELAFEGKRWFDLLRMGRRNNYERKSLFIEYIISEFPEQDKFIKRTKLNDPNGWYLPIHVDEMENNPLLTQNPYYPSYE